MTDKPDVIKFLLGEGKLNGRWYGDDDIHGRPKFWWRTYLREYLAAQTKPQGMAGGDEADLKRLIFELIGEASVHCWDGDINANFNSCKAKAIGEKAFNVFRTLMITPSNQEEDSLKMGEVVGALRLIRENVMYSKNNCGDIKLLREELGQGIERIDALFSALGEKPFLMPTDSIAKERP